MNQDEALWYLGVAVEYGRDTLIRYLETDKKLGREVKDPDHEIFELLSLVTTGALFDDRSFLTSLRIAAIDAKNASKKNGHYLLKLFSKRRRRSL